MDVPAPLSDEQEEVRQEGLRILARIIARHYLEHPELYATGEDARESTPREQQRSAMTARPDRASNREAAK